MAGSRASHVVAVDPDHFAQEPNGWDAAAAVDARLEEILGAASGPLDWRRVSGADAPAKWQELRDWVDWFRAEFAYDHRVVPPCWYRHMALVHVLSALRDHWLVAYDEMNNAAAASEWHRALIPLEQRLRDWASRTGCTASAHRPDVVASYPDDAEDFKERIELDVAIRRAREDASAPAEVGQQHG